MTSNREFLNALAILSIGLSNAVVHGASLMDPALTKMEAQAICTNGECYNFKKDMGVAKVGESVEGYRNLIHKVNGFDIDGSDTRVPLEKTGVLASIGRLTPNQPLKAVIDGKAMKTKNLQATAFSISPCLILTNYHAVFGTEKTPKAENFSSTFHGIESVTARPVAWGSYGQSRFPEDDWAVLQLEDGKCLGNQTGWMKFAGISPSQLGDRKLMTAGYPVDKFNPKNPNQLWGHSNGQRMETIRPLRSPALFYTNATVFSGQSGSPIFYQDEEGVYVVAGLYSSDNNGQEKILKVYEEKFANIGVSMTRPLSGGTIPLIKADIEKAKANSMKSASI